MFLPLAALGFVWCAAGQDRQSSLAHYRAGETFLEQNNLQAAASEFRLALSGDGEPKWTLVWSHIRMAAVFARSGQQERARLALMAARATGDDTNGAQDVVNALLPPVATVRNAPSQDTPPPTLHTQPEYTEQALAAGLEGIVRLQAVRDSQGALDFAVVDSLGLGLDEQAVRKTREQGQELAPGDYVHAEFVLPRRESRWHLIDVALTPPAGVQPPVFRRTLFPTGPGLANEALEHAQIIRAVGRCGVATIRFVVDEKGRPGAFELVHASDPLWGREALPFLIAWEFEPAKQNGWPVAAPVVVTLVWGDRAMPAETLRRMLRESSRITY